MTLIVNTLFIDKILPYSEGDILDKLQLHKSVVSEDRFKIGLSNIRYDSAIENPDMSFSTYNGCSIFCSSNLPRLWVGFSETKFNFFKVFPGARMLYLYFEDTCNTAVLVYFENEKRIRTKYLQLGKILKIEDHQYDIGDMLSEEIEFYHDAFGLEPEAIKRSDEYFKGYHDLEIGLTILNNKFFSQQNFNVFYDLREIVMNKDIDSYFTPNIIENRNFKIDKKVLFNETYDIIYARFKKLGFIKGKIKFSALGADKVVMKKYESFTIVAGISITYLSVTVRIFAIIEETKSLLGHFSLTSKPHFFIETMQFKDINDKEKYINFQQYLKAKIEDVAQKLDTIKDIAGLYSLLSNPERLLFMHNSFIKQVFDNKDHGYIFYRHYLTHLTEILIFSLYQNALLIDNIIKFNNWAVELFMSLNPENQLKVQTDRNEFEIFLDKLKETV